MKRQPTARSVGAAMLAIAMVSAFPADSSACPLCKDAVPLEEAQDGTAPPATRSARAYAYSIFVMMATPFLIVGCGALVLVSAYRRSLARQALASHDPNRPHAPSESTRPARFNNTEAPDKRT